MNYNLKISCLMLDYARLCMIYNFVAIQLLKLNDLTYRIDYACSLCKYKTNVRLIICMPYYEFSYSMQLKSSL